MNNKTKQLIGELQKMDTSLARYWTSECDVAVTDASMYKSRESRQQSLVDQIRRIDRAFDAGQMPSDDLYVISDGHFRSF